MSNILFIDERLKQLRDNHLGKSVTEKSISFTEDFKIYFINEYNLESFIDCSYSVNYEIINSDKTSDKTSDVISDKTSDILNYL